LSALVSAAAGGEPDSIEAAATGLVGLLNIADDVERPGAGDHITITKVQAVSALAVLVTECGGGTAATAAISAGVMVGQFDPIKTHVESA